MTSHFNFNCQFISTVNSNDENENYPAQTLKVISVTMAALTVRQTLLDQVRRAQTKLREKMTDTDVLVVVVT